MRKNIVCCGSHPFVMSQRAVALQITDACPRLGRGGFSSLSCCSDLCSSKCQKGPTKHRLLKTDADCKQGAKYAGFDSNERAKCFLCLYAIKLNI